MTVVAGEEVSFSGVATNKLFVNDLPPIKLSE